MTALLPWCEAINKMQCSKGVVVAWTKLSMGVNLQLVCEVFLNPYLSLSQHNYFIIEVK